MENRLIQLLRYKKLSATKARLLTLSLFVKLDRPLSYAEIHEHTQSSFDRVTLYRMLDSFVSKGIIRAVPSSHKPITYVFLDEEIEHLPANDMFFLNCLHCQKRYSLPMASLPRFQLPLAFKIAHVDIIIEGRCPDCN